MLQAEVVEARVTQAGYHLRMTYDDDDVGKHLYGIHGIEKVIVREFTRRLGTARVVVLQDTGRCCSTALDADGVATLLLVVAGNFRGYLCEPQEQYRLTQCTDG